MASRTRHAHRPECTTAFRRAAKSLESWVLSDFGRLSMTSRSLPALHQQLPQAPTEPLRGPTSSSPTSPWTTPVTASAASVTSFPQSIFPAPSYAPPPTPRGHADWTPDVFSPGHISRSRQPSTSSTTSSVSATSSFGSAATSIDDLPDYNAFLRHQGTERIKPFLNDNREVFQALREVEGGDFEGEGEGRVTGGKRRWRQ